MTKESIIELQKIDCNCNDCKYMVRDIDKFNQSLKNSEKIQFDAFESERIKLEKQVDKAYKRNELEVGYSLEQLLRKSKFQFNKKDCVINYGNCSKLNKPVSFIPNTCQLETQDCFEHRRAELV